MARKVIFTKVVYKYDELSQVAKEKVMKDFLETRADLNYIFEENCEYHLSELLPNSDLKIQYSLNYCQDDNFNIYGLLDLLDVLKLLRKNFFTEEECQILAEYISYSYTIKMQESKQDFIETMVDELNYYNVKNINYNLLERFNSLAQKFFKNLCDEMEEQGYNFFYEITEEEIEEMCEINGYEFLKDGTLF